MTAFFSLIISRIYFYFRFVCALFTCTQKSSWHTARMTSAAVLPDLESLDRDALKALIVKQHGQLLSQHEQLLSNKNEIESLQLLIAKLRRMQFGRKSEKLDRQIAQLELKLEELQAQQAAATAQASATRNAEVYAKAESLSGLRREVAANGRRCFGDSGIRASTL
jgi:predicted RecB family endonuclease